MRTLALRLLPGRDLRRALEDAVAQSPEGSAFVLSGIGSLARAELRFAGAEAATVFDEPLEIVSLAGTLAPQGAHLHVSISTADGRVVGGHVGHGCVVRTTAEILLALSPEWRLSRAHDPRTGHAELVVAARLPPA